MQTGPAKHKDYIMSSWITMTPTWPGAAAALPLAWVCLNLQFELKDSAQFKQVCTYADAQLKHVVCIRGCSGAAESFQRGRSRAKHVIWGLVVYAVSIPWIQEVDISWKFLKGEWKMLLWSLHQSLMAEKKLKLYEETLKMTV